MAVARQIKEYMDRKVSVPDLVNDNSGVTSLIGKDVMSNKNMGVGYFHTLLLIIFLLMHFLRVKGW